MACISKRRGRWVVDFYDHQGIRRLVTLPQGTAKKEAKKRLREIEEQVDLGVYFPKTNVPEFSKVADDWLKYKKPNLRKSTFEQYEGHIENHLKPYFGRTKINRINFDTIEKFMNHCTSKDVNPATLKKFLVTLGGIFKYSVNKKLCYVNPVRDIEKPKITKKKRIELLKPYEIRALIGNASSQEFIKLPKIVAIKW